MSKTPVINARPLSVYVLPCDTLTKSDRARVSAFVTGIKSGDAAKRIRAAGSNYGYIELDPHGRVGVITWRGMEVALLFKRQVLRMELQELDATPAVFLKSLDEAWIQVDLLENQPSALVSAMSEQLGKVQNSRKMTDGIIARQREESEMLEKRADTAEAKVTELAQQLTLERGRVKAYVKALGRKLPDPGKATVKRKVKAVKKLAKKTKK